MVLWTLFRTRLTKKHLFQIRKFAQLDLREVLTPQSSLSRCFHALSAKAGATFTWFCLRVMSREEISMPAKICLSKINWFVSEHRQLSLLTIASRYYHEFKQKLFDVVNYSVR